MSRVVNGLQWAKELVERPSVIPKSRPRGPKAIGVRYEKALAKELGPVARHGVWFEYGDAEGRHYCQVDFLLELGERICIIESKYTWVASAYLQLERLYAPVLALAAGRPIEQIYCLQVCKNITFETRKFTKLWGKVEDALAAIPNSKNRFHTVQWLPGTPLWATPRRGIAGAIGKPLDLPAAFGKA